MKYLIFLCPICLLNIFCPSSCLFSQHFGPLSPLSCQVFWSPSFLILQTFFGPPHMCAVCVDFKDRAVRYHLAPDSGGKKLCVTERSFSTTNQYLIISFILKFILQKGCTKSKARLTTCTKIKYSQHCTLAAKHVG